MGAIDTVVPNVEVPESDSGLETTETVDTSTETVDTSTEGGEQERPQETTEQESGDGRVMSPQLKTFLKELSATNPKLSMALRNSFMEARALRQEFPQGLKEVRAMKQFLTEMGGQEGWQKVQGELQEWNQLDQKFIEGDPSFVATMAENEPEAFTKLAPHVISKFAELDPEGYEHVLAGVVINTIADPLSKVYEALAADDKTKPLAQELAKWYRGIEDKAKNAPVKKVDPQVEKLKRERAEFEEQQANAFTTEYTATAGKANRSQIETDLSNEFKKAGKNYQAWAKANPSANERLIANCGSANREIIGNDKDFIARYGAAIQARDKTRALAMLQGKMRSISPEAVRRTFREFNSLGMGSPVKKPVTPSGNGSNNSNQTISLSKEPNQRDIDWSRTKPGDVLSGKAYLKGKKELHQWQ